eukprot:6189804-Prymnesium_polylepis.1
MPLRRHPAPPAARPSRGAAGRTSGMPQTAAQCPAALCGHTHHPHMRRPSSAGLRSRRGWAVLSTHV